MRGVSCALLCLLALTCLSFPADADSSGKDARVVDPEQRVSREFSKIEKFRNLHFSPQALPAPFAAAAAVLSGSLAASVHGDPSSLVQGKGNDPVEQAAAFKRDAKFRIAVRLTQLMEGSRAAQRARDMAKHRMDERMHEIQASSEETVEDRIF